MTTDTLCPCCSTIPYVDCCAPLHLGQKIADTAENLMRSRYCAFVLKKVDYIVATTAPFQQHLLHKSAISDWARQTAWAGLKVINHTAKLGKHHAQVEFKAFFYTDSHHLGDKDAHHELSTFVTIPTDGVNRWYFLDPTVPMSVSQKQPCPCGRGEKYKRCCGKFLG